MINNEKVLKRTYYILSFIFYVGMGVVAAKFSVWFTLIPALHLIMSLVERQLNIIQLNRLQTMFDNLLKHFKELQNLFDNIKRS